MAEETAQAKPMADSLGGTGTGSLEACEHEELLRIKVFFLASPRARSIMFCFEALRLLLVKCLRLALLLTSLFRLHLPIFLQLSAGLGCRANTAWGLSQGCHVMPRQRLLVPDGSAGSFLFASHLPRLCCLFLCFCRFTYPAPISPPFWLDPSPAVTVPWKP